MVVFDTAVLSSCGGEGTITNRTSSFCCCAGEMSESVKSGFVNIVSSFVLKIFLFFFFSLQKVVISCLSAIKEFSRRSLLSVFSWIVGDSVVMVNAYG